MVPMKTPAEFEREQPELDALLLVFQEGRLKAATVEEVLARLFGSRFVGAGSGLDADLLDGKEADDFLLSEGRSVSFDNLPEVPVGTILGRSEGEDGSLVPLTAGEIAALLGLRSLAGKTAADLIAEGPVAAALANRLRVDADQALTASEQERGRLNIGTDYAPGAINITSLSGGVLPIPAEGDHFVLTWPGNADVSITGFGNLRPAGKAFSILIPRTAANTGGTANALGNKVAFIHSASGAGLDLTMNKRMVSGSPVFTYEAYPNANSANAGGISAAALYEQLTFVPLGAGRHRLVRLPDAATGVNANGVWTRSANGEQECRQHASFSHGSWFGWGPLYQAGEVTWTYPAQFVAGGLVASAQDDSPSVVTQVGAAGVSSVAIRKVFFNNTSSTDRGAGLSVKGRWKP